MTEDKYSKKYLKYKNLYLELNKSLKYQSGGTQDDIDNINNIFKYIDNVENLKEFKIFINKIKYNNENIINTLNLFIEMLNYLISGGNYPNKNYTQSTDPYYHDSIESIEFYYPDSDSIDRNYYYSNLDLRQGILKILIFLKENKDQIIHFLQYLQLRNYQTRWEPKSLGFSLAVTYGRNFTNWMFSGTEINSLYYMNENNTPEGILSVLVNLGFIELLIQNCNHENIDTILIPIFDELYSFFAYFLDHELKKFYQMLNQIFTKLISKSSIEQSMQQLNIYKDNFIIKFIKKNNIGIPEINTEVGIEEQNIKITEIVLQHIIDQLKSK